MALGYTIHEVIVGTTRTALPINTVQEFEGKMHATLLKMGSIRKPTDAEIAIYEALNEMRAKKEAKTQDAPAKKLTKAEKDAEAKKAAEAEVEAKKAAGSGTSSDPEEIENI